MRLVLTYWHIDLIKWFIGYIEIKIMLSGFKFSRLKSGMLALFNLILSYLILSYSIHIFDFRGLDLSVMNEESHQNFEANIVNRSWL